MTDSATATPALSSADAPPELQPLTELEERLLVGPVAVAGRASAREEDYPVGKWAGAQVRAEVVRWLAVVGRRIDLEGVEVTGWLDLADATLTGRLRFRKCLFREPIDLRRTSVVALDLSGSWVAALLAAGLRCDTLNFGDRAVAGRVDISTAQLGYVSCSGLLLNDPDVARPGDKEGDKDRSVLDARVLTTTRSVDLNAGFEALGRVRFTGASIGGQLNFRNAVIHRQLSLHETTVSRALYLRDGLFLGQVNLAEARITGRVDAVNATFADGTPTALNLNGTSVGRAVQLNRAVVEGGVSIRNSRIQGSVRMSQVVVHASAGDPGEREGLRTPEEAAAASTAVLDALPQHLRIREQEIARREWKAPQTRRAGIDTSERDVAVRIDNSMIGSALDLTAAAVEGSVDVTATSIEGGVDLGWARLGKDKARAFRLSESKVGGTLTVRNLASLSGRLDLSRLTVGRLDDDPALWAEAESYDIRGLTYQAINADDQEWSPRARREWLRRQSPFSPQPYEQLAALLMHNGRRQEAWRVLEEERGARRRARVLRWWQWPGNVLSGLLFGHGYRPEFALGALVALSLLGWILYDVAWDAGAVRPTSATETVRGRCTSTGACFEAWRHSFENAFPFLGLGGRQTWRMDDRVAGGLYGNLATLQVVLGWVFATAGVAGLTRRAVKT